MHCCYVHKAFLNTLIYHKYAPAQQEAYILSLKRVDKTQDIIRDNIHAFVFS